MRVTSIIITAFLFLMTISIISNSVYFEQREKTTELSNRIVEPTVRYRFRCYFIQFKFNDCNNCYYNYIFNDVINIFIGLILLIVFM